MPKFPEPPDATVLRRLPPQLHYLPAGTRLWRIYFRGGHHPGAWNRFRDFGPVATARFDHHLPPPRRQARHILYAALAGATCVAEVFQARRVIDRAANQPWLVGFSLAADVALLDLTGAWPTAAGASMALASGPRPRAQRWSQAIYEAYPDVQGLWYPSSMYANRPAVALYERAEVVLPAAPDAHRALADPLLLVALGRVAQAIGYTLV